MKLGSAVSRRAQHCSGNVAFPTNDLAYKKKSFQEEINRNIFRKITSIRTPLTWPSQLGVPTAPPLGPVVIVPCRARRIDLEYDPLGPVAGMLWAKANPPLTMLVPSTARENSYVRPRPGSSHMQAVEMRSTAIRDYHGVIRDYLDAVTTWRGLRASEDQNG